MTASRFLKILSVILLTAVVFTLPLAGCKVKTPSQADPPGGSTGGGATPGDVGGPSPGDPGDSVAGRTLGDWSSAWQVGKFKAGQYFRYEITIKVGDSTTKGWYSVEFSPASGDNLRIDYAGNVGAPFSGSFTSSAEDPKFNSGLDFVAWAVMMPLLTNPFAVFFTIDTWNVGKEWSVGAGDERVSFKITGKRSFAGIEGVVGEFYADGQTSVFVLNPYVPLALYVKWTSGDKDYTEYKLLEANGF